MAQKLFLLVLMLGVLFFASVLSVQLFPESVSNFANTAGGIFGQGATYSVTFYRYNMSDGILWGVTVSGTRYTTRSISIEVSGLSGTVNYFYDMSVVYGSYDENSTFTDIRYACDSGCNGTVSGQTDLYADYVWQFKLSMSVSPPDGGTTSPPVGIHWYTVDPFRMQFPTETISATPNPGYYFSHWFGGFHPETGSYSGTDNPATVTIGSGIYETAFFYPASTTIPTTTSSTVTSTSLSSTTTSLSSTTTTTGTPVCCCDSGSFCQNNCYIETGGAEVCHGLGGSVCSDSSCSGATTSTTISTTTTTIKGTTTTKPKQTTTTQFRTTTTIQTTTTQGIQETTTTIPEAQQFSSNIILLIFITILFAILVILIFVYLSKDKMRKLRKH